jgi:2-methylcitrate dehydratase PrpD
MSLSRQLAVYAANTRFEDLPAEAVAAAKNSLLDAVGVTLAAGGLSAECRPFIELAFAHGGAPQATVIGLPGKLPATQAALANGAMAHALDYEDVHDEALCHPNAQLVPAALAVAEMTNASGRDLVAAIAVGCDLVCRLGLSLTTSPDSYGWYPPPLLGGYGAAAAAGRLLRLSDEQMLDAFSLVLSQVTCSSELKYSPHSAVRAVRDGFAAQAGVLAALLAQRGVKGFELPFEGKAGFFALYARGQYDPALLVDQLGTRFEGVNVSYKAWPACRGTHAFIEAALALRAQGLRAEEIARIGMRGSAVNTMLFEPVAQKQRPQTAIDAKFSLPYTVGCALVHGAVGLDSFRPEAMKDEAVLALATKTSYAVDPSLGTSLTEVTRGVLRIETGDGRALEHRVTHPLGHPQNPIPPDTLTKKFVDCGRYASAPLSASALESLAQDILAVDSFKTLAPIMDRLSGGAAKQRAAG